MSWWKASCSAGAGRSGFSRAKATPQPPLQYHLPVVIGLGAGRLRRARPGRRLSNDYGITWCQIKGVILSMKRRALIISFSIIGAVFGFFLFDNIGLLGNLMAEADKLFSKIGGN